MGKNFNQWGKGKCAKKLCFDRAVGRQFERKTFNAALQKFVRQPKASTIPEFGSSRDLTLKAAELVTNEIRFHSLEHKLKRRFTCQLVALREVTKDCNHRGASGSS